MRSKPNISDPFCDVRISELRKGDACTYADLGSCSCAVRPERPSVAGGVAVLAAVPASFTVLAVAVAGHRGAPLLFPAGDEAGPGERAPSYAAS